MSEKWTKGPWSHGENELSPRFCERIYANDPGPEYDFTIGYARDADPATRMANANLFAASPELYDSLRDLTAILVGELAIRTRHAPEDLEAYIQREYPAITKARAVMAKARGE